MSRNVFANLAITIRLLRDIFFIVLDDRIVNRSLNSAVIPSAS